MNKHQALAAVSLIICSWTVKCNHMQLYHSLFRCLLLIIISCIAMRFSEREICFPTWLLYTVCSKEYELTFSLPLLLRVRVKKGSRQSDQPAPDTRVTSYQGLAPVQQLSKKVKMVMTSRWWWLVTSRPAVEWLARSWTTLSDDRPSDDGPSDD